MSSNQQNDLDIDNLYRLACLCKPEKENNNEQMLSEIISMLQQISQLETNNSINVKAKNNLNQLREDIAKKTVECLPSICNHFDAASQQITVPKVVDK